MQGIQAFCFLVVVAVASASSLPGVSVVDPVDVVAIVGSKIYLKSQDTTGVHFGQYIDWCQRNGLRTASFRTAQEHEAVRSYITTNNFGWNMWIGGWDINHEGIFKWFETAEEFTYADWGRDPSDYAPVYNCVFIGSRSGGGKFFDTPCATSRFVPLCEARLSKNE